MLAGAAGSDDRLRQFGKELAREKKRGRGRSSWALYRRSYLARGGLGFCADCIGRLGGVVQERDGVQRRKEAPTGGVHLSAGGGYGADTLSGRRNSGLGPNSGLGQNRSPGLLFFFSYFFSFFFSVFYFN
jgi:hypothetical protein